MAKLSAAQIAQYAYQAGFRGQSLVYAVAIALAESGGNPNITGDQDRVNSKWGSSIGLWQIRSLRGQYRTGGTRDGTRLRDPLFSARSAFAISNGGKNFGPWSVWWSNPGRRSGPGGGVFRRHLSQAQQAAAAIQGGDAAVAGYANAAPQISGTSVIGDLGPQQPPADPRDTAKSLYGYLGWFVDHPEVGPIILQAAREGWDPMRLQGALGRTNWWKNTAESARQFDALLAMDPATARRRIMETGTSIQLQAKKFGIGLNNRQVFVMSVNALRFGWNPDEIQLSIASQMKWNKLSWAQGGAAGQIMADVRKTAAEYLVPVTTKQTWQWARRIVGGAATIEAVQQQMKLLAALRFPHLVKDMQRGVTPGQFFAPHRNAIAETLEISPDDIDMLSPGKWGAIAGFKDPRTGKKRAMTVTEAARYARMQPEWAKTDNAWKSVTEAGDAILQVFGEVAR